MSCICGKFIAQRIKTVYNIETNSINEYLNDIEYIITKITNTQYLKTGIY